MALKDHKCKLTTVKKWEKELNCIEKVKGFNTNWIRPGAKSIKKDGLKVIFKQINTKRLKG